MTPIGIISVLPRLRAVCTCEVASAWAPSNVSLVAAFRAARGPRNFRRALGPSAGTSLRRSAYAASRWKGHCTPAPTRTWLILLYAVETTPAISHCSRLRPISAMHASPTRPSPLLASPLFPFFTSAMCFAPRTHSHVFVVVLTRLLSHAVPLAAGDAEDRGEGSEL